MHEGDVEYREATAGDLPGVLAVQHEAFGRVAVQLGIDPADLPPLAESLDGLRTLHATGTRFFVAIDAHGRVVGSVRGTERDGTVDVGRLVVATRGLRCGIATRLMRLLESSYPESASFVLFTGADAVEPLALYTKLGYSVTRRDHDGPVPLVWLEKQPAGR